MAIRVECPTCHQTLEAPDEYAGRAAKCPKCSSVVQLPADELPTAIPQQPKRTPNYQHAAFQYLSKLPWKSLGVTALVLSFLLTLRTPPGLLILLHYGALLLFAYWMTWLAIWEWLPSWHNTWKVKTAAVVAAVACACAWWYYDYSIMEWRTRSKADANEIVYFTDYGWRGTATPFYRKIRVGEYPHAYLAEGALTESSKRHGPWKTTDWPEGGHLHVSDEWYWYGEEITEGEWHLRNDKR
jgi:hypothetical protein